MRGAERARRRRPGALVLPGVAAVLLMLGCTGPVAPPAAPSEPGRVVPTSVRIDAIGVDETTLSRLGIAADGSAEVPQDYARVGWFDRGSDAGPTVLLGHVDSRSGPAVFYELRDLRPGNVIEVGLSDGTFRYYAVERARQVRKDEFPTFDVFGAAPGDVLRLVTCAGEFDRGARSYTDNLVVHARAL